MTGSGRRILCSEIEADSHQIPRFLNCMGDILWFRENSLEKWNCEEYPSRKAISLMEKSE